MANSRLVLLTCSPSNMPVLRVCADADSASYFSLIIVLSSSCPYASPLSRAFATYILYVLLQLIAQLI